MQASVHQAHAQIKSEIQIKERMRHVFTLENFKDETVGQVRININYQQ
jgi:hypothetical protein